MTIDLLVTFLGWCTVLNIAVLLVLLVALTSMHDWISELTSKMFGIRPEEVRIALFRFFMQYRLIVATFNLIPYVALKIML